MVLAVRTVLLTVLLATAAACAAAQDIPAPNDSRNSLLRKAMLGVLPAQAGVPSDRAQRECVELPVEPPNDRLEGPHGDALISTQCEVVAYETLNSEDPARWISRPVSLDVPVHGRGHRAGLSRPGHCHRTGGRPLRRVAARRGPPGLARALRDRCLRKLALDYPRGRAEERRHDTAQRDELRQRHRRVRPGVPSPPSGRPLVSGPADLGGSVAARLRGSDQARRAHRSDHLAGRGRLLRRAGCELLPVAAAHRPPCTAR